MKSLCPLFMILLALLCAGAAAADHRVEALQEAPPADELAPEIADALASTGMRVVRGTSRTVCDIWLCKQWPIEDSFSPSPSVIYPFQVGELLGVIRYRRDGEDFRAQEIPSGVYTMRYARQPVDGNHVGTSDTLDFILLAPASQDRSAERVAEAELFQRSAEASSTTHPAILSLLRHAGEPGDMPPAMHHEEARDLWSLRVQGTGQAGDKTTPLVIEIVVVGFSDA